MTVQNQLGLIFPISIANGGTNNSSAIGATGTIAQSNGTQLTYTTATYPTTAGTSLTLLRSNGTNIINTTSTYADTYSVNTVLYASSANTVTGLATVNSAAFATTAGGAPHWLALTDGQFLIGSTAGAPAAATLTNGTNIAITNASNSITVGITGTIASSNGGTGFSTYTTGDTIYASATNVLSKLGIGTTGQVLTVVAGVPSWQIPAPDGLTFSAVSSSTQALAVNTTYYTTYAGLNVMTLPASSATGSIIEIIAGPSGNTFKVAQNAGQNIVFGAQLGSSISTTTGTGGSLQTSDPNSAVVMKCIVANTTWVVMSYVNSITVV